MKKGKQKQDLKAKNKQRWVNVATALWNLAVEKKNPNAMRILFEMIGLSDLIALLLQYNLGDKSADIEAIKKIAEVIEREDSKNSPFSG